LFVTGLVLAAGSAQRLGRPKQLLPYQDATLLDACLQRARSCRFDQLVVVLGAASTEIRARVDLSGCTVVQNEQHGLGCSSSVATALAAVHPAADGIVLLLGDQPGIEPRHVTALLDALGGAPLGACRYSDGLGHPLWFGRQLFEELSRLHGDKAVWRLLERHAGETAELGLDVPVPLDVDTEADYARLVSGDRR
jgi:molybdenum cofactor cytidylyltransferase